MTRFTPSLSYPLLTPLEFLYLETGAIPVRFLISSRRLVYLHYMRNRVYRVQTDNPSPGDIAELLKEDFNTIEEPSEETAIHTVSEKVFKKFIREMQL